MKYYKHKSNITKIKVYEKTLKEMYYSLWLKQNVTQLNKQYISFTSHIQLFLTKLRPIFKAPSQKLSNWYSLQKRKEGIATRKIQKQPNM